MVLDLLKDGTPLFSSNPGCPVLGYQIYKDDGAGNVVSDSQPVEVKLETENVDLHSKVIVNAQAAYSSLVEGKALQFVLVAVTESGPQRQPGRSMMFELTAPPCDGTETLSV